MASKYAKWTGPKKTKPEPALIESDQREWRMLREFPDYEISNDGRLRRKTPGSNTKAGAHIRIIAGNYPHYRLSLPSGIRIDRSAHQLVASEFLEPRPSPDAFVLHMDDNRLNCTHTNLRWGSHQTNMTDALRNGRIQTGAAHSSARKPWYRPRGSAHSSAKLDETKVHRILADNRPDSEIAASYKVDSALIYRIKRGLIWKHVSNPSYCAMLENGRMADAATA
jgi:hypothetical protein